MEIHLNYRRDENTKATIMATFARLVYPDAAVRIRLMVAQPEHNLLVFEGEQRQYAIERGLQCGLRDLAAS